MSYEDDTKIACIDDVTVNKNSMTNYLFLLLGYIICLDSVKCFKTDWMVVHREVNFIFTYRQVTD